MESVRPPSIEQLLSSDTGLSLASTHGRSLLKEALRLAADRLRRGALPRSASLRDDLLADAARSLAARPPEGPRPVLNGTGVLLHTNLGRAPLAEAAREAVLRAAGPCDLELDLDSGARGRRDSGVRALLREVFASSDPRWDALVTNNTAAALLLALDTVANGRPVAVSRGELVAIGGDFRVPSILARSGASLLEVGTTNKTTLADYEEAVALGASALLKVHPSNFRIVGYTGDAGLEELGALAARAGIPLVYDAGAATPVRNPRLPGTPVPREALDLGVSLLAFSADKTLGGPQGGLLLGTTDLIGRAARNPLARALRPDKPVLAALAATLGLHARGESRQVPFIAQLEATNESLERRAHTLAEKLSLAGWTASATASTAVAGGGSGVEATFPSWAVAVEPAARRAGDAAPSEGQDGESREELLGRALRAARVPLITRVAGGRVLVDLAAIPAENDDGVLAAFEHARRNEPAPR